MYNNVLQERNTILSMVTTERFSRAQSRFLSAMRATQYIALDQAHILVLTKSCFYLAYTTVQFFNCKKIHSI